MKLNLISGMFCLMLCLMTLAALAVFLFLFGTLAALFTDTLTLDRFL